MGEVVNLLSVDVQRLSESVLYLNGLWLPLLWIIVCFVYLWQVWRVCGVGRRFEWSPPVSPPSSCPVCTVGRPDGKVLGKVGFA